MGHNKNPYHYEKRAGASIIIEAYNQLCGDQFKLYLDLEEDVIRQAFFHGYGCAVSKASTSLLIQQIEGKRVLETQRLIDTYLNMLKEEELNSAIAIEEEEAPWNELAVFRSARNYPARMKCATLSWEELHQFLEGN